MSPNNKQLIIATRKSPLAQVQADIIKLDLKELYLDLDVEILPLSTEGDKKLTMPLATIGGKGLFVKELEQALLDQKAHIAVHSTKDMPIEQPDGLDITVYYQRHDPRDAFISNQYKCLDDLPKNATIGTASLRRQCLLKQRRPDLTLKVLRGNVQTRLKKLDDGEYDAIVLAAAGLERLNLSHLVKEYFDPSVFIPAPTQGIMCIESRNDDMITHELIKPLHHEETTYQAICERALNAKLQRGCQVPIGAYSKIIKNKLYLRAMIGKPDGSKILRADAIDDVKNAVELGVKVAEDLLDQGANKILNEVYQQYG